MSMTTEQREAIKSLEKLVNLRKSKNTIKHDTCICGTLDLDTALSLIKEQKEEIKNLQKELNEENKRCMILANNDKFKEQVINLIIDEFYKKAKISTKCYLQKSVEKCMKYKNCKDCIKQYFVGLVEKE